MKPNAADTIAIHVEAERVREAVVVVGDSVRLTVRGDGAELGSSAPATWFSDDHSIVRLSGSSTPSVYAHGESFGSARVIATSGARADTIIISVLSAPPGGHCDEGGGLEIAARGSYTTTAAAAPLLCLAAAPADGADYVIVPFNASLAAQRLRVDVSGEGIMGPSGPSGSSTPAPPALTAGAAHHPHIDAGAEFDRRLREREARDLEPLVRERGRVPAARMSVTAGSVPAVGDTLVLNVNPHQTCTQRIDRKARVRAVGSRAILLEDTSNPAGGFTDADYQSFSNTFDQVVYPTITASFGTPTDIDGNGRVMIVFTRAVNELTAVGSESYVAGFFYARDLFPTRDSGGLSACTGSNVAEILYMLTPDPGGAVNGNVRTRELLVDRTIGVLAHELQHLINASRRLHILGAQNWNEEFWLNEGLSHIAEELIFYATTPYDPGQAITVTMLRQGFGHLARFNQHQVSNASRFSTFLRAPEDSSPLSGSGLGTRGASWAFLRYAADRNGGDQNELWQKLIDADARGYDNLLRALGGSPLAWMHDWTVANYMSDLFPASTRFRQPSWNYRSVLPALTANGGSYPLKVTDLRAGREAGLDLVAAGSATVWIRVPPGSSARVRFASGGGPPPPELRYTIVRIR